MSPQNSTPPFPKSGTSRSTSLFLVFSLSVPGFKKRSGPKNKTSDARLIPAEVRHLAEESSGLSPIALACPQRPSLRVIHSPSIGERRENRNPDCVIPPHTHSTATQSGPSPEPPWPAVSASSQLSEMVSHQKEEMHKEYHGALLRDRRQNVRNHLTCNRLRYVSNCPECMGTVVRV
jgi:hypothetical protein